MIFFHYYFVAAVICWICANVRFKNELYVNDLDRPKKCMNSAVFLIYCLRSFSAPKLVLSSFSFLSIEYIIIIVEAFKQL